MSNIIGTNGNDTLLGTNHKSTTGDDTIKGLSGNDLLSGDGGNDTLIGGVGNDTLLGGSDDDSLVGGTGNNVLRGDRGNDTLDASYSSGNNILRGDIGDDYLEISYSTGNNRVSGGNGDDYFLANEVQGTNTLSGEDGNDIFYLSAPDTAPSSLVTQTVDGGTGEDSLSVYYTNATGGITTTFDAATNTGSITATTNQVNYKNIEKLEVRGTTYADLIVGTNGNDLLFGGSSGNDTSYGNDTIFGGEGNDELNVDYSTSNNILDGGVGNDQLNANSSTGNNLLSGGDGKDVLSASGYHDDFEGFTNPASGNNTLNGGAGDDNLSADYSTGDNLLSGGDGNDSLSVSSDAYRFVFNTSGNNTLDGGAGDDNLVAKFSTGDNLLSGGDGNDSFSLVLHTSPSEGATQTVDGGAGDDLLSVSYIYPNEGITSTFDAATKAGSIRAGMDVINYKNIEGLNIEGTVYDDYIVGSNGNDRFSLYGNSGNDTVDGGTGDDLLSFSDYEATGGITSTFNAATNSGSIATGTDVINYKNIEGLNVLGTAYNDYIVGSNGNDTLSGGDRGKDTIDGGTGDDLLSFSGYQATRGITSTFNAATNTGSIRAGANLVSYKNIEQLNISGTTYNDYIVGSNGNDTLSGGGSGNDTLNGGAGDDTLNADYSNGKNLLSGGDGNDSLSAFGSYTDYRGDFSLDAISGNNTLNGGAGDDYLVTNYSSGNNLLSGGDGNDSLSASGSSSLYTFYGVYTVSGNNTLDGGAGNDYLNVDYSSGNNLLNGGDGNDILTGGKGNDSLYGGDGTDTFAFNGYNQGIDTLYDFNATNELIQVSATGFGGGLSTPSLQTSQFTIGTSAITSAQRFIYNDTTGALYFDLDGSASGFTQVQFAQISGGVSLTNNNFVVV
ncbi:calcium-binding protein [Nostoc sp. CHAB 5836]|uniref:beta strand repeat-containing protein n=1 Tax=Nostoc sp. CHAB 5836 TaxID=2780404 RepID=UPI001E5D88AD|nr:calcium-binding protein [Nostoc sp. CHAB 5836]MCC5615381.1 calcium-binding protein [Nostoc sp. CHAB 5836]